MQLLAENDVARVHFDILEATKPWPEEVVPVQRVGTMTLNRNPCNYFAETEQVAYHLGHDQPATRAGDQHRRLVHEVAVCHFKTIAATGAAAIGAGFVAAIAKDRRWTRTGTGAVSA